MNAPAFDTLKLAKKLEDAGFTTAQAQGAAAALAETFGEDLATGRDIQDLESRLDLRFKEVEVRIRDVETSLRAEIQAVRADMRDLENRMTIRLGTMLAAAIVLMGAMIRLL